MGRWLWDGSGNDNNDYGGGGVMGGNGITSGHVCHYKRSLKGHNYVRFTMTTTVWMDLESLSQFVIRRSNFLGLLRGGREWDSNPVCEFSENIFSPSVRDFMVEILQLSYAIRVPLFSVVRTTHSRDSELKTHVQLLECLIVERWYC
ncbi:hypothetical protein H0E87_002724 [Populus deltoides]|uniref:Uncharacterized protein n=1 Tax=Populus deltoides TaxID=3696 RepID=A0A8T2ZWS7_POPDE|nr:hypothetical protein H0E87_002724 [Populus deltoides]